MIKWLLTDLEDACSGEQVWDYLELEMACSPKLAAPAAWEDPAGPPAPSAASHDDLLWRNCMWGGRCGSHDHGAFSPRCDAASTAPRPGDSLLKKQPPSQQPSPPPSPRPHDDQDKEMVFVSMTDVVSDVRWTAPVLPPPRPASPAPGAAALYVHEDHSYHLTRHSCPINMDALGVQTPSDSGTDDDFFEDEILEELPDLDADDVDFFGPESVFKDIAESVAEELQPIKKSVSESESNHMSDTDEEIDVVSVEKARALPTNPTVHDRHQLQQTVADAVGRRGRRHHRHHRRHHRRHHHHHRRRLGKPKKFRSAETFLEADDLSVYHKPGRGRPRTKKIRSTDTYDSEDVVASKRCRSPETSTADESEDVIHKPVRGRRRKYRRVFLSSDGYDSEDKPKRRSTGEMQVDGSKGKRSLHNNMERQRRIDLSNLVHAVRQLVPAISDKDRSPRIEVLREAADYCRQLQVQATQLASYKHELQLHNERLQRIHQAALQNLPTNSLRKLHHHASCHRPKKTSRRSKNSVY